VVETDPYWEGYEHGFEDGYAMAFYELSGEWPEAESLMMI